MKIFQRAVSILVLFCLLSKCSVLANEDDDDSAEDAIVEDDESSGKTIVDNINYETPTPRGHYYFYEPFDDITKYKARWVVSSAKKEDAEEDIAKYDGRWNVEQSKENALKGDFSMALKSKAKHHAIAVLLDKPFHFQLKPLVLQYEVNFQEGQDCGGAYIKLLSSNPNLNLAQFHDKTPYTIMFGPDKCGNEHKVHFIFRHKNPLNGTITEKHSKHPEGKLEDYFKDKKSHLYTLILKSDNTYDVLIDQVSVNKGSLLEDFTPPVNPPKEIDDPYDRRPDDWDEREKIPDPNSKKPDDWDEDAPRQIPDPKATKPQGWLDDEPEMIPDTNAEKPSDWEDEMDGEWEAPLIANPKCEKIGCGTWKPPMLDNPSYKGKWRAPLIANPNYKGKWKPRKIPNPDYYEDDNPFRMTSISAVGLELWSMSNNILFDNILITDDRAVADDIASKTWILKRKKADKDSESFFKQIVTYTNAHPWMWAVFVVVIGLPIVLVLVFCCSTSDDKKKSARAKKTDAVTPDDPVGSSEPNPVASEPKSEKESRSTETEKPEELKNEEESVADEKQIDEPEKDENSDEKEAEETSPSHDGSGDVERSPRRRKLRRE